MKKLSLQTLQNKIITYQVIVVISFIFGVVGLSITTGDMNTMKITTTYA